MSKRLVLFTCGFLASLLFAAMLVLIMWLGKWEVATQPLRLNYFGEALLAVLAIAALFGAGALIGHLKTITMKAGPVEASLSGDD
jgi:hypothetical protein